MLADAKQVKHLPGRPKRDPSDSRWLAACFERGAVTSCFVATPEFRIIRLHTRYRRDLTEERTREKQRAEKLLESAAIKLSTRGHRPARGDRPGHHGPPDRRRAQPQGAGPAGPRPGPPQDQRAGGRRWKARSSSPPSTPPCSAGCWPASTSSTPSIAELTAVIERLLAPYEEQLQQAESMPGWGRRAAQDAVAETGVDMTRFRTGGAPGLLGRPHPAGQPVRQARSGRAKSKKGNRYLGAITGETAVAAGKTQTREGARYRRLARRRGKAKALRRRRQHPAEGLPQAAVQPRHALRGPRRRLLRAASAHIRRQVSHHVGKLGALGFEVTLSRIPEPEPGRNREHPGRLTHNALPTLADP